MLSTLNSCQDGRVVGLLCEMRIWKMDAFMSLLECWRILGCKARGRIPTENGPAQSSEETIWFLVYVLLAII